MLHNSGLGYFLPSCATSPLSTCNILIWTSESEYQAQRFLVLFSTNIEFSYNTVRVLTKPYTNTIYSEAKLTLVDRGGWAYQISPNNVILPQSKVINSFCQVPCRAVWSYSWHNRNSKTNWSISWPLALAGAGPGTRITLYVELSF